MEFACAEPPRELRAQRAWEGWAQGGGEECTFGGEKRAKTGRDGGWRDSGHGSDDHREAGTQARTRRACAHL